MIKYNSQEEHPRAFRPILYYCDLFTINYLHIWSEFINLIFMWTRPNTKVSKLSIFYVVQVAAHYSLLLNACLEMLSKELCILQQYLLCLRTCSVLFLTFDFSIYIYHYLLVRTICWKWVNAVLGQFAWNSGVLSLRTLVLIFNDIGNFKFRYIRQHITVRVYMYYIIKIIILFLNIDVRRCDMQRGYFFEISVTVHFAGNEMTNFSLSFAMLLSDTGWLGLRNKS